LSSDIIGVRCADALSRTVGCHEVGELVLEREQFPDQCVVLGIGDLRVVEHVVAIRVIVDRLAQFLDPLRGLSLRHALI
jgi:hypothetical protein